MLVTAFWGCLGDQGSGTNNYKGPRRGKGIETWPSAFSKYCFKKKTKFLVRHLGRLPEEQKQGLLVATNGSLVAHGYTKKVLGTADDWGYLGGPEVAQGNHNRSVKKKAERALQAWFCAILSRRKKEEKEGKRSVGGDSLGRFTEQIKGGCMWATTGCPS